MLEVLAAVGELAPLHYHLTELYVAEEHFEKDLEVETSAGFGAVHGEGFSGLVKEVLEKCALGC